MGSNIHWTKTSNCVTKQYTLSLRNKILRLLKTASNKRVSVNRLHLLFRLPVNRAFAILSKFSLPVLKVLTTGFEL